jgi:hypothetical protein
MKQLIVGLWSLDSASRYNLIRQLDLASQHYFVQVLGWVWSIVFSLSFLCTFHFGLAWIAPLLLFGGVAFTIAVFREGKKRRFATNAVTTSLSRSSRCVWQLDSEA